MEISIKYQLLTMLYSSILGLFIGLIYDVFKIVRKLINGEISNKTKNKLEKIKFPLINVQFKGENLKIKEKTVYFIVDILFFVVVTPVMQIFIYTFSSGIVRWYIFLGVFIGFMIYYVSVSRIIIIMYEYIAFFIKVLLSYLIYFIKLPFDKIIKILKEKHKKKIEHRKLLKREKILKEKEENKKVLILSGKK